ncbi:hypothetical protein Daus18300_008976 [Diaporthe australafricana]|uniref:Uncharacterized protein n=1 Tax=Diaporthe australafricana TaxID=127596 RepID=A0ABR3WGD8_9PEZI
MASRTSSTPPNSPAASSLCDDGLDHIDIPYDLDALAQSVDNEASHDLPTAVNPLITDPVEIPRDRNLNLNPSLSFDVASQSDSGVAQSIDNETSHDLLSAGSPAITDPIEIPRNLDVAAQPDSGEQRSRLRSAVHPRGLPPVLPAVTNFEEQHPFGLLNSIHLRLRIGRDTSGNPNALPPAPPARVVQRNEFKRRPPPNGDLNDSVSTITQAKVATRGDEDEDDNFLGDAMKPTFPPRLEGVAKARLESEAKTTEDLAGLGPELAAAVLAKREYNEKFGAFRRRWSEVQFALADKAEEMRGRAGTTAGDMRPIIGTIGRMFAFGKAVDVAAFPGWSFGEFDERTCCPQGYLSSLFPELTHRAPAGLADPLGQATEAPALLPSLQWDFSLGGIMAREKREGLRDLWAAAAAGQWETVDEMTSGVLAVAEELLGRV